MMAVSLRYGSYFTQHLSSIMCLPDILDEALQPHFG